MVPIKMSPKRSLRWFASRGIVALACLFASDCTIPLDLCSPVTGRVGFFSQGDCILTRSNFAQGHEWLTFFGNEFLAESEQFADSEIQQIANGNRRVDWPSELLVHLDNSIFAYYKAMVRYTDLDDNQAVHFLLRASNSEREAIEEARASILQSTRSALRAWVTNRERALSLLGRANHTIQDSFSEAHSVRNVEHPQFGSDNCKGECGCVERIKAYRPRDAGSKAGILFHGGREELEAHEFSSDNIGHNSRSDSIYLPDRDCRSPEGRGDVKACLNQTAQAAAAATTTYLSMVRDQVRRGNTGLEMNQELLQDAFDQYVFDHLSICSDLTDN